MPEGCDPQRLLAEFPHAVDTADVYRQMREERGVRHGPPFFGLQALYTDGAPAGRAGARLLARLRVPDEGRAGAPALHCHPIVLDTCLQAVAGAVLRTGSVPVGGILPRGVEVLRLYGAVPLSGYCLVTLRLVEGDRYTADFRLWADDGSVAADATGVEFRHVPAESAQERFANRLLQTSWEPAERPSTDTAPGSWTLLAEAGREAYARELGGGPQGARRRRGHPDARR